MRSVIVDYVRSPFTPAYKGSLAKTRSDEFASQVVKGLLARHDIDPATIEDLLMGCAMPEGEQGLNVGRLVGFLSELPLSVAGVTVNRFCGSSMQTAHMAAGQIACGAGEAFIVAGMESMSRIPMTGLNPLPHPGLFERYEQAYIGMGMTAENLAKKYKISRKAQDEFAVRSHEKATEAQKNGGFEGEIIPIQTEQGLVSRDECIRPGTNVEKLADLNPAFDAKGSVTAGTSSPLTDGAVALLITSEDYADRHGLPKMARIKSMAVAGCAPEIMGIGPVGATQKALKRANLTLGDIDIIELNEAFSAQSMAVLKDLDANLDRVNIEGGAIAMGHPLGASGARILGKAAQLLERHHKQHALATMCIGGGQGIATVLEAI